MKLILLAATALIAAPVMAQTSGSAGTTSPTTSGAQGGATMTPDQTTAGSTTPDQGAATADPATAPTDATTTAQPTGAAPMSTGSGDPVGGYAPTGSAVTGGTPGTPPVFRPAQTPDQAYPAPAPLAKYPVCKKGQYDKCIQRGGK